MYREDIYRVYGKYEIPLLKKAFIPYGLKYIKLYRKINTCKCNIIKCFYIYKLKKLSEKTFIQIPYNTKIGRGFYIGHNGRVIINPSTIIGDNCNVSTGVTIGQENRGIRKGTPVIGNEVWIGTNAVIVGNITIGNDVLIAPNSYVNFDVPSHSIVIGNPGKIIKKENATKEYIQNIV